MAGALMALGVLCFDRVVIGDVTVMWTRLSLDIAVGVVTYCVFAWLLKRQDIEVVISQLKANLGR